MPGILAWIRLFKICGPVGDAIALFTIHAISSLVFSVVHLAPSSPNWGLALTLGSFLAIAGAAVGMQGRAPRRLTGLVSGGASVALLGFYSAGQLSGQQVDWAIGGAVVGLVTGGGLGVIRTGRVAIALVSSLCSYGAVFGFAAWTLAAVSGKRWGVAIIMGLLTGLYLLFTQRGLRWTYRQWRSEIVMRRQLT